MAIEINELLVNYDPVTAPDWEGQVETWRILAGLVMCLALCLVGVALATNFRGLTSGMCGGRWLPQACCDEFHHGAGCRILATTSGWHVSSCWSG